MELQGHKEYKVSKVFEAKLDQPDQLVLKEQQGLLAPPVLLGQLVQRGQRGLAV